MHLILKLIEVKHEEDLESLPRWGVVAFAARCARHVTSTIQFQDAIQDSRVKGALESAITAAEAAATEPNRASTSELETVFSEAGNAARVLTGSSMPEAVSNAAMAAVGAAQTAYQAAIDAERGGATLMPIGAYALDACVKWAVYAIRDSLSGGSTDELRDNPIIASIRNDYAELNSKANSREWTDESPVSPRQFVPSVRSSTFEGERSNTQLEGHFVFLLPHAGYEYTEVGSGGSGGDTYSQVGAWRSYSLGTLAFAIGVEILIEHPLKQATIWSKCVVSHSGRVVFDQAWKWE